MSYKFSKISQQRLSECHPDLQRLFNEVIKHRDCSILCGHRTKEEQDKAVEGGFSKTPFPASKHNKKPSMAVDVLPSPVDWNDTQRMILFAGFVMGVAVQLGINIRWGGDWNMNGVISDEKFKDFPHFELI